jgi:RNA polymerase sigma factor (sigma-70 family)
MRRGAEPKDLEELYRTRFRAFLLSVTALLGDGEEALDVVQDAFARALRRRSSFRGDGDLEAWVWRIVLNGARDRRRAQARERPVERLEPTVEANGTDDDLRHSLFALPERQRLAVFLRYYADLTYDQIAEALGVRHGTVAASLNAAHARLRKDLEEVTT